MSLFSDLTVPLQTTGERAVLNAAALTYVAAMLTSLLQLLYWVSLATGGRRRS